jgi:signal transduction protein with GAF and PtsI domain
MEENQIIMEEDFSDWQNIVDIMAKLVDVPSAIITRVDPPYIEVFKASAGKDNPYKEGIKVELANHYCEKVITTEKPLHVWDARKMNEWMTAPEIEYSMYSYLGYPISLPSGDIYGTLCVLDSKENQYSEEVHRLMNQFKNLIESNIALKINQFELARKINELTVAQEKIEVLEEIVPICSSCKKIRKDDGYWEQIENFISSISSKFQFSHGMCPECETKFYQDYEKKE